VEGEQFVLVGVQWLKLALECASALVIGLGFLRTSYEFLRALAGSKPGEYAAVRLMMGRYLALALELQLGADILGTSVAPSWEQIGKLGAIAVIRTGLNFFLALELRDEHQGAGGAVEIEREVAR
jgi:uncharacterized membrane protein